MASQEPKSPRPARPRRRWTIIASVAVATIAVASGVWMWWASSRTSSDEPVRIVSVQASGDPAARPTSLIEFKDGCMTAECHSQLGHATGRAGAAHSTTCMACHMPDQGGHVYPVIADIDAACKSCHDQSAAIAHAHDERADMGCTNCHAVHAGHGSVLLKASTLARTCEQCHPSGHTSASLHSTAGDGRCDMCHDMHGSKVRRELRTGTEADSCSGCHDTRLSTGAMTSHAHANLADGCIACHREHGGMALGRLKAEPAELCLACHTDIRDTLERSPSTPDAKIMREACTTCHDPHDASLPAMMRRPERDLCLECHAKPIQSVTGRIVAAAANVHGMEYLHGPVKQGRCGACHTGHGGRHAEKVDLLANRVPLGQFDLNNYAQCFACHDRALVLDEGERATAFRNGTRNLHKLHIQAGERSRGCASCHAAHGSNQPRLIAETVAFEGSEWNMKMGYTMTAGGGSCSPGCHAPMDYTREPQGRRPSPPGGFK